MFDARAAVAAAAMSALLVSYVSDCTASPFVALLRALACSWVSCFAVALLLLQRPPPAATVTEAEWEELLPALNATAAQGIQLYLDLLKRILLNVVYYEQSCAFVCMRSRPLLEARPSVCAQIRHRSRVLAHRVAINLSSHQKSFH